MKKLAFLALLALVGCASQDLNSRIYTANQGVTAVIVSTDSALNSHLITAAQAQSVSTIAHQITPLLDSARAAAAINDPKSADKTLNLVQTLLAGLDAYLPPAPLPAK